MEYELLLSQHFAVNERTETSVAEIASLFRCSTRYTKTIIHQLHHENKVIWETLKGRGKKPFITVLRTPETILMESMNQLWLTGKFELAIEQAKQANMIQLPSIQQWLHEKLGLQSIEDEHVFVQSMYEVELFLDPLKSISRHDTHMLEQIHETLFTIGENGKIEKNLLVAYETGDCQKWSFILKKGIVFHDGSPLTAEEVVQSLYYTSPYYEASFRITSHRIVNKYEFVLELDAPFPLLPSFLASQRFIMLNKAKDFEVGCGPFMLKQLSKEKIVLETFPNYFKERPWIDRVELLITDSVITSPIHYEPIPNEPYRVIEQIEEGATYLFFNSQRIALQDETVRAYLWHSIEPKEFVLNPEYEYPAYGWLTNRSKINIEYSPSERPIFSEPLYIGYQQIRASANHLPQAEKLRKVLKKLGIQSELICINFQEPTAAAIAEIDIFIGGSAMLENTNLSFYIFYTTFGRNIFQSMNDDDQQQAYTLLQQALHSSSAEEAFYQLECFLQTSYHVKFLKHRKHYYYVRAQSPFARISFDSHGRINYRKLYITESN